MTKNVAHNLGVNALKRCVYWGLAMKDFSLGRTIHRAVFAILVSGAAHATDAGSCYGIGEADARAYCLAKARNDPGTCYTIQNAGLRSICLAEVRR
ncbi:hypothetical protein [Pseudomonas cremoricolorata]|uniref:hypothetical protein n=1 Tax=Pseudomonas cremoricolorata TaxID=157783 RepID=UPI0012B53012|nr:hypothetical protein [Pseudomonas cremoricolorata]